MPNQTTPNRNLPLPHAENKLRDDVERIRSALGLTDSDLQTLINAVAGRALLNHTHGMNDVTGLNEALAGSAGSGHNHSLDSLSNVSTTGKANGQVLLWQSPSWIPVALQLNNVTGLETALNARPTTTAMNSAIQASKDSILNGAGAAFDTLTEIAAALGNDPNLSATLNTAIGLRVLTTTYTAGMALKADLASPDFTGEVDMTSTRTLATAGAAQLRLINSAPGADANSFAGIYFLHTAVSDRRFGMKRDGSIGIFSAAAGGAQSWAVDISGNMVAAGNVSGVSDERVKTNVKRIENALETLLRINGVMFDKNGQRETGVIAQQTYTAIPELVNRPKDPKDMWSVKYQNALGYIVEAFRDVVDMIEELREEVKKKG